MAAVVDDRKRRNEIRRELAQLKSARGIRSKTGFPDTGTSETEHSCRLRSTFEKLGPLFCCFGIYLSSRIDLLPTAYIEEFSTIRDQFSPVPFEKIQGAIRRELGKEPEDIYMGIEEAPVQSRLMFQSHNAWLHDLTPVRVKVSRTALGKDLLVDREMLTRAADTLKPIGLRQAQIQAVVADFQRTLDQQLDLRYQTDAFERLFDDSQENESLAAWHVRRHLSTRYVQTLDRPLAHDSLPTPTPDLCREIAITWLREVLTGLVTPVDPSLHNLSVHATNRVAFTEGFFTRLSTDSKINLWGYLVAASVNDPDTAYAFLSKELDGVSSPNEEEAIRNAFRQSVIFRDARWHSKHHENSLAAQVFMHFKLVAEFGFRPLPSGAAFLRGLYQIASLCEQARTERDWLAEALHEVRLDNELQEVSEMLSPQRLQEQLRKYAAVLIDLPKRLDESLIAMEGGNLALNLGQREKTKSSRSATRVAILLLLTVVILFFELISLHEFALSVSRINTILIIFLALLVFSRS